MRIPLCGRRSWSLEKEDSDRADSLRLSTMVVGHHRPGSMSTVSEARGRAMKTLKCRPDFSDGHDAGARNAELGRLTP